MRALEVLVGGNSRDSRFVNIHVFSNVPQHHRPQVVHAVFEEISLPLENGVDHFVDGGLPLVDALDEKVSRL